MSVDDSNWYTAPLEPLFEVGFGFGGFYDLLGPLFELAVLLFSVGVEIWVDVVILQLGVEDSRESLISGGGHVSGLVWDWEEGLSVGVLCLFTVGIGWVFVGPGGFDVEFDEHLGGMSQAGLNVFVESVLLDENLGKVFEGGADDVADDFAVGLVNVGPVLAVL
jgi:hypothetical protein